MSEQYDTYLQTHKDNVAKAYYKLLGIGLFDLDDYDINLYGGIIEHQCVYEHDSSKYREEEYSAYDEYFNGSNKSFEVVNNFNYAWLHHIHNNPHHWQHWVLLNDDPEEGTKVLDMPVNYIVEMICDWWSFSISKNNWKEIFNWYNKRKNYIQLSNRTREIVEFILDYIKNNYKEEVETA